MQWVYEQPVKIIFGGGKIKELSDIIKDQGYEHGILVCDPFFRESTLVKELLTNLGSMIKGIYSDVSPNPDVKEVDKC
ncbi:MAG: iron-containing alcohol dehydrogenase, partial [Spirochaetales bacterium]|nr:iron-containing alcohol dehydrogenase [Spirochaetales bacterium]